MLSLRAEWRTCNVEGVAGLGHETPWAGCVEERGWVIDFDAGGGSEVWLELGNGQSGESQQQIH